MNRQYIDGYLKYTSEVVDKTEFDRFLSVIKMIKKTPGRIYTIGNGGSALIASHFTTDLLHSLSKDSICLADSIGLITAIGNDYSFDYIFSKQIHDFQITSNTTDLLIAFSCSGKSPNILRAIEEAYDMGMDIIFISGLCQENKLANIHFMVPATNAYVLEGIFSTLCHLIVAYLRKEDYELC